MSPDPESHPCAHESDRGGRAARILRQTTRLFLPLALIAGTGRAVPAAPVDPNSSAGRLIDLHVKWLGGWDALDRLNDLKLTGTLATAGLSGPIEAIQGRDGFSRLEYDLKVIRGVEAVSPEDGWATTPTGQVEDLGEAKIADERRSLARSFGAHLRGEGVEVTAEPEQERGGRTWAVVRFTYPGGDLVDLLVDPGDGSSEWQRSVLDTREAWNHSTDWRMVDGVRFPFRQEAIYEQAVMNQTVVWDSVEANTGIDPALFVRPGAAKPELRVASGATSSEWAPIELFLGRYIVLQGAVDGTPTEILLDSGAGMSVLDQGFADSIGVRAEGSLAAEGTGGMSQAGIASGVRLEAAGLVGDSLSVAVIDLSGVASQLGRPLHAILGKEAFNRFIVDLDYPNSRICFHEPETFRYDGSGHRVPLTPIEGGHRELEAQVEGLPPARFHLDTGNGGTLDLFRPYTDEHDLLAGRSPVSERLGGGVGGETVAKMRDPAELHHRRVHPAQRTGHLLACGQRRLRHAPAGRQPRRRDPLKVPGPLRLHPRGALARAGRRMGDRSVLPGTVGARAPDGWGQGARGPVRFTGQSRRGRGIQGRREDHGPERKAGRSRVLPRRLALVAGAGGNGGAPDPRRRRRADPAPGRLLLIGRPVEDRRHRREPEDQAARLSSAARKSPGQRTSTTPSPSARRKSSSTPTAKWSSSAPVSLHGQQNGRAGSLEFGRVTRTRRPRLVTRTDPAG